MAKIKGFVPILLLSLVPTLLIWLPFFLRLNTFWTIPIPNEGMATVASNYDGPLYIAVSKSMYDPEKLKQFTFNLPYEYYAAHFPLYPALIRLLSFFSGYPYATLIVTALSSIGAIYVFSKFISEYVEKKDVLWITFLFSVFPARWLTVRSVGSPEPLFILFVILSVYLFRKHKYFLSSLIAGLAAFTKPPGILLFPSFLIAYLHPFFAEKINLRKTSGQKPTSIVPIFSFLLIPVSTFLVFCLYKFRMDDFLAYFHSGDNIHLFFPPFQIFNHSSPWVGTFWLEEVIFVYLLGFIGIIRLFQKDAASAWFAVIFFISTLFIAHRDILRYSLPLVPFLFAGYSDVLTRKEVRIGFYLVIIPIFLNSISFISKNVMPIADWGPLL